MEFEVPMFASTSAVMTEPKRPVRLQPRRYAPVSAGGTFGASAQRVFEAWMNPSVAGQWLFATASRPMTSVSIDARVGGAFRFVDRNDGEHIQHTGTYVELVSPWRLAFTLRPGDCPHVVTRVVAEIVPSGARGGGARRFRSAHIEAPGRLAGCELFLTHEDVPRQFADRFEARWTGMLYGLGLLLDRA